MVGFGLVPENDSLTLQAEKPTSKTFHGLLRHFAAEMNPAMVGRGIDADSSHDLAISDFSDGFVVDTETLVDLCSIRSTFGNL